MVNHKMLYKIILVLGLLLTMILTLSLTKYSITYAEEAQPPTVETGNDTENDRFDFDSGLLEQARDIIGTDSSLSDEQITELYQIGFNDQQITLLVDIMQNDASINPDKQADSTQPILYTSFFFILLLLGFALVYNKIHNRVIF